MTTNIVTPQSLQPFSAVATAAKTTLDDAANAVLLTTAGASGAVVYGLTALARATVTATKCQLYRSTDGGVTLHLIRTALMSAYTMAQTTVQTITDFGFTETSPLRLAANERLYVGIGVALAGGVVFHGQGEGIV